MATAAKPHASRAPVVELGWDPQVPDHVTSLSPLIEASVALRTPDLVQPVFSQMREGRAREGERHTLGHTANNTLITWLPKVSHEGYFLIAIHKFVF